MTPIESALNILRQGGLVAIPTETVYGLAADATNDTAILSVFQIKGRPADHPLSVAIAAESDIANWVRKCPDGARQLMEAFWPGPLTLILPKQPWVSDLITAGQDSVGLRCPDHPLTQHLLTLFAKGLVAPSANRFGKVSPTTAQHVIHEFGDQIDYILDGGACQLGIESTIIDYTRRYPVLLRPGHIGVSDIEAICHDKVRCPDKRVPKTSGNRVAHYAPNTPMTMMDQETLMVHIQQRTLKTPAAILTYSPDLVSMPLDHGITVISMPGDPIRYARQLYDTLRKLDQQQLGMIYLEALPEDPAWAALNNRLCSAATGSTFPSSSA